ncbi:transcription termination factor NusA [Candidatus Sumerlaeota bacterium]|nr:transcription termination factor NusA [Candidatus Sumerlaeota bacterium]
MKPEELKKYIFAVSKDRALPVEVVCDALEQALLKALAKGLQKYLNPCIKIDRETGEISLWSEKVIVPKTTFKPDTEISLREATRVGFENAEVGQVVVVEVPGFKITGRITAQQTSQFIQLRLRDAVQKKVCDDYRNKIGQLVVGVVESIERDHVVLRMPDGVEASLSYKHTIGNPRHYKLKDSVKAIVWKVDPEIQRGPIVIVTRTAKEFILRLFEQEVPEIKDGTVEIVGIARDPGVRAKIAVKSKRQDVDAVGACVGQRGSRVQQVVRELEIEKVDVIGWSEDPAVYISEAINSGCSEKIVTSVDIVRPKAEGVTGRALVKVKKNNVAAALGRKGINVDLANAITGYRIEVVPEGNEMVRDAADVTRDYLNDFLDQMGVSDTIKASLANSAFNSVEALSKAQPANLLHLLDFNRGLAISIIKNAQEYFEEMRKLTRHTKKISTKTEDSDDDSENLK